MITKQQNNYAYIDGANLHKGTFDSDWILDYARFRVWLTEKYGVKNAYSDADLVLQATRDANDVQLFIKKEKAPDADKTAQGSFS